MCASDDFMNHKDCVWHLWYFHNKQRLAEGVISAMVENWAKGTLALAPWSPDWTATWRRKGLSCRTAAKLLPAGAARLLLKLSDSFGEAVRQLRRGELGGSPAAQSDSLPGSHMENWQIRHLFLYGISLLLKCTNISAQRSSTGPQNRIYRICSNTGLYSIRGRVSPLAE